MSTHSLSSSSSTPSLHGNNGNSTTMQQQQQQQSTHDDRAIDEGAIKRKGNRVAVARAPLAAWFGSEYLSSSGMVTSMTSKKDGNEESSGSSFAPSPSPIRSKPVQRNDRAERERDRDGDSSPRIELAPSYVVAPLFPFMGQDDGSAAGPSFGGWANNLNNPHDQPVLKFMPGDERIEQYTLQGDQSTNTRTTIPASTTTQPQRTRVAPNPQLASSSPIASPDADEDVTEERKPLPPRAGSARSDPKYSPSLLGVTNSWWQSCSASHFLVQPAVTPSSPSNEPNFHVRSPPLLTHTPYVTIRMLVCMALLPPAIFEERLASLAKIIEYDFLSEASGDSIPGLTLPMFHTSLCELAGQWTQASTVQQYTEFLSNLFESITEEAPSALPTDSGANTANNTARLLSPSRGESTPSTARDGKFTFSPTSPASPEHARSIVTQQQLDGSMEPRPRIFKSLPSSVLAALTLAAEEVALERSREREAQRPRQRSPAAHATHASGSKTGKKSKHLERERNALKEAMALKSAEMIDSGGKSKKSKTSHSFNESDTLPSQQSLSLKKKRSKDESLDEEELAAEKARRQRKKEKKAAAASLAAAQQSESAQKKSNASKSKRSSTGTSTDGGAQSGITVSLGDYSGSDAEVLLEGEQDAVGEGDEIDSTELSRGSSERSAASRGPSQPASPRNVHQPVSPRKLSLQQQQQQPALSPRLYMSSADIRRSARSTVDGAAGGEPAATSSSPVPRKNGTGKEAGGKPSSRVPASGAVGSAVNPSARSNPSLRVRYSSHTSASGGGDGEEDDGTEDGYSPNPASISSGTESRVSSAGRARSNRSETKSEDGSETNSTLQQQRDREDRDLAAMSLGGYGSSNQPPSMPASKQSRILALQQQALLHRARLSVGRTHSGHVLPAYIIVDETATQPQQTQVITPPSISGSTVAPMYPYGGQQAPVSGQVSSSSGLNKPVVGAGSGYTYGSSPSHGARYPSQRSSLQRDDAIASHSSALAQLARMQEASLPPSMQVHTHASTIGAPPTVSTFIARNRPSPSQQTVPMSYAPVTATSIPLTAYSLTGPSSPVFIRSKPPVVTPASAGFGSSLLQPQHHLGRSVQRPPGALWNATAVNTPTPTNDATNSPIVGMGLVGRRL